MTLPRIGGGDSKTTWGPPLIDEAVEAVEELIAKGECSPLTPVKVMRGTWRLFESVNGYVSHLRAEAAAKGDEEAAQAHARSA
jgi:hypothetical protein